MANLSLAARYRPQSFAEVGGQELAASALSRAAATDSPAPAYLFSGTRGVGKTTMARIFAKALNCENGPGEEPCNECPQCRKVTEGRHVDVCEIDGASNNRVEDARSLRETIGYAPMEGRYKVFIIDEAHMLSNSAFNALLKTLEEPPPRVVFIFATTEAHKFPITIVSRCQHFVFGHLSEEALASHLAKVLQKEDRKFEDGALKIIARRAAGSVRDSMSLLDQTLALGGDVITVERTRAILGLAGNEIFEKIFSGLAACDLEGIIDISRQILQNGLDIGYFTREFSAAMRNLFLLREGGEKISGALGLTENEKNFLLTHARTFSPAHLHAAWQLALDSQRDITQNPEPGAALEMLLLNIALLPRLLPVGDVGAIPPAGAQGHKREKAHDLPESSVAKAVPAPSSETGDKNRTLAPASTEEKTWSGFREFCEAMREKGLNAPGKNLLSGINPQIGPSEIILNYELQSAFENAQKQIGQLQETILNYFGNVKLELRGPGKARTEMEIRDELARHPELQPCLKILNARIAHCREIKNGEQNA